ncbi:hypothetical protein CFC21_066315 [Triticum aestivum]|uniref:NIF system FeS cluster assembly NifU C-terminal domain-containing protein n=3 Tax=Triticum TaxID=4564 RepID=A0A9R1H6P6_WHEAT|nr:uncharacterized protein LOC119301982 [Triticum dicoccoides]XP_037434895.1 uncharacterized protein LOC119301982 [Triticum dicoccoides]XP_037434896.1 uncharacterized protein LOC119301982 [Triticum dicoccoides]XP_044385156.1 uncharacterized protein LOC123107221 [Triticum aestivum]XP_048530746.1 uncharacterized protein LOC125509755 [Triticum urartu]XP_048530748.1 uncharacterized protein LOC125509755 [Triticum urartu]KAF7059402.1 hypothetical protein CFC21_066315 [Triticum aestivum]
MAFVAIHARLAVLPPRLSAAASSLRSAPPRTRLPPLRTSTGHIFRSLRCRRRPCRARARAASISITASLDLTEDNVRQAIVDAKAELAQLFDTSVGITGQVDLAELDGPFVKLRLKGKFWHTRATVVARIGNYLKNRIPEILEVEIEDEDQLDDSPAAY